MPNNDPHHAMVQRLIEIARRDGVQLDDPQQFRDFMLRFGQHLAEQSAARARPDPDGLKPWQREAADKFITHFLLLAKDLLPAPPRYALLMTFLGDDHSRFGRITVDEEVEVALTFQDGQSRVVRPAEMVEAGTWKEVAYVETVGPALGYILCVSRPSGEYLLLAWDFRALCLRIADCKIDNLLARLRGVGLKHRRHSEGRESRGWHARAEREGALNEMFPDERRALMRRAYEDELTDPDSRRIPLRGLIQAGGTAIWDAGGTGSAYGLLQKLSVLCRAELKERDRQTHVEVLDEEAVEAAGSTEHPEHYEMLIRDTVRDLEGVQREAVQHYLRARVIHGVDLKTYCAEHGLPYDAVRKAAARGLSCLREKK